MLFHQVSEDREAKQSNSSQVLCQCLVDVIHRHRDCAGERVHGDVAMRIAAVLEGAPDQNPMYRL